jgi:hypothetical protein
MMRRYGIAMLLYLGAAIPPSAVIPVAADGVIAPARYFDLHGKTLRFTPSRRGYVLAASKVRSPGDLGIRLGRPDFPHEPKYRRSWSWRRSIPFGFPFGGSTWRWMAHELGHRWGIALKFRNPLAIDETYS